MELRRQALEAFLREGDKSPPPVFAGRQAILDDLEVAARSVWNVQGEGKRGRAGMTRIIQGAPGAGKSALLAEIARRVPAPVRVLTLNSADVISPTDILVPLAQLANPDAAPSFLARCTQTRALSGSVGLPGLKAAGRVESALARNDAQPTLSAFRDWVCDLDPGTGITGPVIIAIDEAQRINESPVAPLARLLQGLHDNSVGLPIALVLAGLSDTADCMTAMGLSRGVTVHPVGALHGDDITALMTGFCVHFGIDPEGYRGYLQRLATPCEGWPRHLHFALTALATSALETGGDLARVDWATAEQDAAKSRTHYYRAQQSPLMRESVSLVAAVLRDLEPNQSRVDVINSLVRNARGPESGIEWQIPDGMTPRNFADHLIHQGALQEMPDHTITCPIPTFRTHLIKAGRLA